VEQAQGGLIRAGNNLATRESLEREQRMIAVVDRGIGHMNGWAASENSIPLILREEQQRAVHHVLDSKILQSICAGAAGTGKTATLHEIDRGLRDAGREIVAVAPTRSAVEELRKVGFLDAMTISRLLEANTEQAFSPRKGAGRGRGGHGIRPADGRIAQAGRARGRAHSLFR
jgi:hypothetical protein